MPRQRDDTLNISGFYLLEVAKFGRISSSLRPGIKWRMEVMACLP